MGWEGGRELEVGRESIGTCMHVYIWVCLAWVLFPFMHGYSILCCTCVCGVDTNEARICATCLKYLTHEIHHVVSVLSACC
jgi:hypothetical protein